MLDLLNYHQILLLKEKDSRMSKGAPWLRKQFGRFWLIQILLIATLVIYSLTTTISLFILVNDSSFNANNTGTDQNNTVVLTLIFESHDSNNPINWNSLVTSVSQNTSLYTVMQNNFQLNTTYTSPYGYLIQGINSIIAKGQNAWTFYYYTSSGWVYATKGVSLFLLNHDYIIKWVFGPASS